MMPGVTDERGFKELPASNVSLSLRRPVYGVGINDSDYLTSIEVKGKVVCCRFYTVWKSMLSRCYSRVFKMKNKSYEECTTCNEWLTFSTFKAWMKTKDWKGKQLDKDILVPGNKIYGPESCIFVKKSINNLLIREERDDSSSIGVSYNKRRGKYASNCKESGKSIHIGHYESKEEAELNYVKFKAALVRRVAKDQDEILKNALLVHAKIIEDRFFGRYSQQGKIT